MVKQPPTSIDSFLKQTALDASIKKKIEEHLRPILEENEALKKRMEQLPNEAGVKEGKYSTVRQQLQALNYLLNLEKLTRNKKVEQIGRLFSFLLNRHPQRARKPFSSFHELTYSNNKAIAENILKDLRITQKQFEDFGNKDIVQRIQKDIDKLMAKHFNEIL